MSVPHSRTTDRDDYCTPHKLYKKLNDLWDFDFDAAATKETTKCAHFFKDSLNCMWAGKVFCNPPFSNKEAFLEKAVGERNNTKVIVMVVPNSSRETSWWREYALQATEIINLFPRVNYELDGVEVKGAGFPTALLVYYPELVSGGSPRELYWRWNK